ncbi:pyridoxal 5'-phosphate synthase lyase subunit PdxS [Methanocaldococcus infernus]|uniref:Pyridoxal 5'-phosphate synthase subunit PdxS n=1 Tax=Methanocaldococcus infernus (strain DSM 11812 / JCM 15783 / ME) TaxID=573063 RepID=D5VSH0_METIM|nr:pyridoxal 5'-phosphate synthase lyase subunit PdxS [Methanocaldococcus infernus]ADG13523.1 pyridoxine biosynthesis protein [Methanocaldococcus infernus ME]
MKKVGTDLLKKGFAKMVKHGVVMDVTNVEQAQIAEEAGAVAVMALERVPADIRASGGVARMSDPALIEEIMDSVSIPVMAKCRIGHIKEAEVLEAIGVDMIDESEVLTQADPFFHIYKKRFKVPFVCGARNLGEAVRRIWEGAAMIRTKGEAGTGNIVEAVRHMRLMNEAIRQIGEMEEEEIHEVAKTFAMRYAELAKMVRESLGLEPIVLDCEPIYEGFTLEEIIEGIYKILMEIKKINRLPVVNFAAGGVATPADAALMMALGSDGVFVGSGIFKSENPLEMAKAIVEATYNYDKPEIIAEVSKNLGLPMKGIDVTQLKEEEKMQYRGD